MWSVLDLLLRQGVQFGVSIALARMLAPAAFGMMALVTFFITLSTVFVQGGITTALIQRIDSTKEEESAAFWINTGAALVLAGALVGGSGWLARFYEAPPLAPLIWGAAAQIVISALGSVHYALLSRTLRFDRLLAIGLVATAGSSLLAVAAALHGLGVWSLLLQALASATLTTIGVWLTVRWRPAWRFSRAAAGRIARFGVWVGLSSTLEVIYSQGFALLLGKLYGIGELGLYNRGASTQALPSTIVSVMIGRIALPLFAERADDPAALRRGARLALGFGMLVNLPAMLGLSLLAPLVITVLFGPQWRPAAPVLSILAISGVLLPLHMINLQILLGAGRSAQFFRLEIGKKLIGIACIVAGSFFGLLGLAWGQVAGSVLAIWINMAPVGKLIDYPWWRQFADLRGLAMPTLAMAVAVKVTEPALFALPDAVRLLMLSGEGALVYLLVGLVAGGQVFAEALALARSFLSRRVASV